MDLLLRPVRLLGRVTLAALAQAGRFSMMVLEIVRGIPEWRIWVPRTFTESYNIGVGSLFIVTLISAFAGAVTAFQAGYQWQTSLPIYVLGTLIVSTIVLELGPVLIGLVLAGRIGARYAAELGTMRVTEQIDALESLGRSPASHLIIPRVLAALVMIPVLTGLALAGRVGASIASELGSMRVTEQIDALEALAYDPVAYLVVPRVLAGIAMFPVVVGLAMLVGVGAGWAASALLLDISSSQFVKGVRLFFDSFDVRYGLVKAASFGFAVTLLGAYAGLRTRGGAEGVGRAATSAVVYSAVAILVLDAFWAIVWLLGRTP